MRRLLCISGKRFSGKDTFARLLVAGARARGVELATYAFADESKRMFAARRPDVELARLMNDRDYKEAVRPELTKFTIESIAADPLVFARAVARRIDADARPPLVTDLRLRLELDWLRPRFEVVVARLVRPDALRAASGWSFDAAKDGHRTETELDDASLWTEQIDNDGDEARLRERADAIVTRYVAPRSDR
jgi:phosphomevalonate kinase